MGKRRQQAPSGPKNSKKQKREAQKDVSSDDNVEDDFFDGDEFNMDEEDPVAEAEQQEPEETVHEKKVRLAKAYLDRVKESVAAEDEDAENEEGDREGRRDSRVADLLRQEQLEESGRVQRDLASRVVVPEAADEGKYVVRKHRQSVTAVALSDDEKCGFSASKDGLILQWDVETGKSFTYKWPSPEKLAEINKNTKASKRPSSKQVLAIAVDDSGRYLATGGQDRLVHLWDVRTQEHIQAFPGHRGAVSSLVFRQGTTQLFSGSYDRTVKLWSANDRCYLETLFGHQAEVLAVDCLRQERLVSTGRDRTARLFKIPEETQLLFRTQAPSLESCCFLTNAEFISGSDDGSVSLYNVLKKKPVFVARNAHRTPDVAEENSHQTSEVASGENATSGNGNGVHKPTPSSAYYTAESWVGAVASCRGSNLAVSGAGDGKIQLWELEEHNRKLRPLYGLPLAGFVNALAFGRSGRLVFAAVGQEPRLGRWSRNGTAKNGVVMHKIDLS